MPGTEQTSVTERIAWACRGLVYISETDSDVEPVTGGPVGAVDAESLRSEFDIERSFPIESADPEAMFERLTREREWHTERDRANAAGFARLKAVFDDELTGLRVFRVGQINVDIYIVGIDRHGRIAGVRMHAVET